jgi:NAD(P)-dependent dehydrogenase (short-subunit alcohol dehydrogenase family)
MAVFFIIGLAFVLYLSYRLYQHFFPTPNINPNGKYVLISGCDTGFGHALAIELDKQGFNVLAGVLLQDNITSLKNELSPKATVFRLDITKQEDIDVAFELVKEKKNTLHALVNNAGIGAGGNIDCTSMEVMRKVMDVNYFGHVAMTKKFLPLLIVKRDSRVVNICSAAGYIAGASMSAYAASKFALEAFSDCLRREMYPWGLRVSIIEPGFMRTPIINSVTKPFSEIWATLSSDVQERWGEDFLKERHEKGKKIVKIAEDPIKVVRALQHAIMNTVPHIRYRPGWQSGIVFFPVSMLPAWFADWFMKNLSRSKLSPASVSKQLQD